MNDTVKTILISTATAVAVSTISNSVFTWFNSKGELNRPVTRYDPVSVDMSKIVFGPSTEEAGTTLSTVPTETESDDSNKTDSFETSVQDEVFATLARLQFANTKTKGKTYWDSSRRMIICPSILWNRGIRKSIVAAGDIDTMNCSLATWVTHTYPYKQLGTVIVPAVNFDILLKRLLSSNLGVILQDFWNQQVDGASGESYLEHYCPDPSCHMCKVKLRLMLGTEWITFMCSFYKEYSQYTCIP